MLRFQDRSIVLAPSILAGNFARLESHAQEAIVGGADWLHLDVMDGHFVPNISFGPLVVRALRPLAQRTQTKLDVHLMIENPDHYIDAFAEAGADGITVHVEACTHLHRTLQAIRQHNLTVGVTLNPATPLTMLEEVLPLVDLVLVMSVNPGFGGQSFIPSSLDKIRRLRQMLTPQQWLEVDGGVKASNVRAIVEAGANALVAGSAILGGEGNIAGNIQAFQSALD